MGKPVTPMLWAFFHIELNYFIVLLKKVVLSIA